MACSVSEKRDDISISSAWARFCIVDQVGTAAPKLCYDRSHGHSANDASLWLKQGYWKIFDRIFAILHKKDPAFCHTTEESGEVYLKQFDGFLVARW